MKKALPIIIIIVALAAIIGIPAGIGAYRHHKAEELSSCEFGWAFQGKDPATAELLCKQGVKP